MFQTLDDVDFTVLSATSVLEDLVDKCPPAEACHDAFVRMSKATVKMCLSTTGFGSQAPVSHSHSTSDQDENAASQAQEFDTSDFSAQQPQHRFGRSSSRASFQFDPNLRDLFPDQTQDGRPFGSNLDRWQGLPRSDDVSASSINHPALPYLHQDGLNNLPHHIPHHRNENERNIGPAQGVNLGQRAAASPAGMTYDGNMYPLSSVDSTETTNMQDFSTNSENDENTFFYGDPFKSDLGIVDDGQYDYGDGTQLNLFDGFFFGNTGNN